MHTNETHSVIIISILPYGSNSRGDHGHVLQRIRPKHLLLVRESNLKPRMLTRRLSDQTGD